MGPVGHLADGRGPRVRLCFSPLHLSASLAPEQRKAGTGPAYPAAGELGEEGRRASRARGAEMHPAAPPGCLGSPALLPAMATVASAVAGVGAAVVCEREGLAGVVLRTRRASAHTPVLAGPRWVAEAAAVTAGA